MSQDKGQPSTPGPAPAERAGVPPDAESARYWLAALIESADDAIVSKTLDGIVTSWNGGAERIFGYTAEEMVGRSITVLIPPESHDEEQHILRKIRRGERVEHYETIRVRKDGSRVEISLTVSPIKTLDGKIIGASKIARDVTRLKQAERASRESERHLQLITNSLPVLIGYVDAQKHYRFVNPGYVNWFGLAHEEIIGRHVREILGEATYESVLPEIEKALAGRQTVFERFMPQLGEAGRYVQVNYVPDFDPATGTVNGFCVLMQDVTARKLEELDRQLLLELGERIRYGGLGPEQLLSSVTEALSNHLDVMRCLFIEIDEKRDVGTVRCEHRRRGVPPVAETYVISDYSPETLEEIKGGRIIVNCDALNDPRTAAIYETTYEPNAERAYVSVPLFTNERWTAIFWVSDDRARPWSEREVALIETVGERAWLAVEKLRSETEREELLRMEHEARLQAERANRLKDEFLATVSHELRTPLTAIMGWSQMLKSHPLDPETASHALDTIHRNAQAQAQIIDDILDVSRIITGKIRLEARHVSLAPVVLTAVESLRPALEAKNVRTRVMLDAETCAVYADPDRMRQVVWNLLSNAIKFTPRGARSPCDWSATKRRRGSSSPTRARASAQTSFRSSSTASARPTAPPPGSTAAWVSGSPSSATSRNSTAARRKRTAAAKDLAPRSSSVCRCRRCPRAAPPGTASTCFPRTPRTAPRRALIAAV